MARSTPKNYLAAMRKHFQNRMGGGAPFPGTTQIADSDFDNNDALTWSDAADTTSIQGIMVDADNAVRVDHQALLGQRKPITFYLNANASLATQAFFIADRPMRIWAVLENHATAGSDSGAVTLQITKDPSGIAPGSGNAVLSTALSLKATANITQAGTLVGPTADGMAHPYIVLAAGDQLSAVFTGVLTAVAGVVVQLYMTPGFKVQTASYVMNANAGIATQSFFQANRPMRITGVKMRWSAAGTDAGTVTVDVTKETGTTAPGSGTTVLSAAVSAKTTANVTNSASLSATASVLLLAAGDGLSVKLTGTLTALAGLIVTVYFAPNYSTIERAFAIKANATLATQSFFIADRDYLITDMSESHAVAGSDGSAVTLDITVDPDGTAPGAGVSVLGSTFNLKSTANTDVVATLATNIRARRLAAGNRLSAKFTGTLTASDGVVATVQLQPQ